jgi:hypothetical protein
VAQPATRPSIRIKPLRGNEPTAAAGSVESRTNSPAGLLATTRPSVVATAQTDPARSTTGLSVRVGLSPSARVGLSPSARPGWSLSPLPGSSMAAPSAITSTSTASSRNPGAPEATLPAPLATLAASSHAVPSTLRWIPSASAAAVR